MNNTKSDTTNEMLNEFRNKLVNGKIYKIVDNTNDNIYIGSTCQSLKTRLIEHKCHYKTFLKGLCNNTRSFDIIKNNDYEIKLLEACEVKTKLELKARERYFIKNNECVNKQIPTRTKKEWYIDNKEKVKEQTKAYRDANKDKINFKANEKFDCECGGCYQYKNKCQHIKTAKHQKFINNL